MQNKSSGDNFRAQSRGRSRGRRRGRKRGRYDVRNVFIINLTASAAAVTATAGVSAATASGAAMTGAVTMQRCGRRYDAPDGDDEVRRRSRDDEGV